MRQVFRPHSCSEGVRRFRRRLTKVIWKQAASPPLVADLLIAATHNCSTIFARLRQCARPPNKRFLRSLSSRPFFPNTRSLPTDSWLRGTVVERRSLAGKLSQSHARLAADG